MATELRRLRREGPEDMPGSVAGEPAAQPVVSRRAIRIVVNAEREAELPNRCVCCGLESRDNVPVTRKLSWIPPNYYILAVIGLPLFAIAYFVYRERLKLTWWLCRAHHAARRRSAVAAVVFLLCSVPLFIACGAYNSDAFGFAGGFFFLGFIVAALRNGSFALRANHREDGRFFIVGAREPFLSTLPEESG